MKNRGFLSPVTENFLHAYGVGKVALDLALRFGADPQKAFIAGSLHDLGGAVPAIDRVSVAKTLGIGLVEEEYRVPMLVHAKLSDYFAEALFGIEDKEILDAILYHTTCIDNASTLTKIIFLADKIQWDRNGKPPYLDGLMHALDLSLDEGCRYFLKWLWNSDLYIIHPFLKRSYGWFLEKKTFPLRIRSDRSTAVSSEMKEKYFLDQIVAEYQLSFCMGQLVLDLVKNKQIDTWKAYTAAVLINTCNTIASNRRFKVAEILGIDKKNETTDSILPKLNRFFAHNEFNITDSAILNAILHFRRNVDCGEPICDLLAIADHDYSKKLRFKLD